MFKYKNVMTSIFMLFFFATVSQMLYSLLELKDSERDALIICGTGMFVIPLGIFISGKLKALMPYLLATFYVISCFIMSIFNKSEMYLPILFSIALVFFGFFLSSKLVLWFLALSNIVLLITPIFFYPSGDTPYFVPVYSVVFICYNFSGLAMSLFVQAIQNGFITIKRNTKNLKASDRRKDLFWAASAGRMRNSAQRLSDICDTLLERGDVPVSVRERLSEIRAGTRKLFMTLNDAEDYALAESKRMTLKNEPYRFDNMVSEISKLCAVSSLDENIEALIECQPDIPSMLTGDSRRIIQIIMNLFENSVKYTESGSIVISFSSRKTDKGINLRIQVTDTGKGIDYDAAKKMFTVYAEVRSGRPKIHLGLGISKKLVSLMGGFIFARKEKNGGTGFTLTVPQGVLDEAPFINFENSKKPIVLLYMKNDTVRAYSAAQLERMGIGCGVCRTKSEFMMKKDDAEITDIFCDYELYLYDKPIFDIIAKRIGVAVICGAGETEVRLPKNIKRILKPINIVSFACALKNAAPKADIGELRFYAPNARVLIAGEDLENIRNLLDGLKEYKIRPVRTLDKRVISELRKQDYDIIFVCGGSLNSYGAAAKIMVCDDEMYMRVPVVDFGGSGEGCSDVLAYHFKPYELEKILESYLPESVLQYNTETDSETHYEELDPEKGIFNNKESRSAYKEALEAFEDKARELRQNLKSFISSENTEICMALLSGIANACALIGAMPLCEMAKRLCAAAEEQKWKALSDLSDRLFYRLDRLQGDIELYFSRNKISHLTDAEIGDELKHLKTALDGGEVKAAHDILHNLLNKHMAVKQRNALSFAQQYINTNNSQEALTALKELTETETDIKKGEEQ